jgi:ankyrin repeat protein
MKKTLRWPTAILLAARLVLVATAWHQACLGETKLGEAESAALAKVRDFLDGGGDVNAKDKDGQTELHKAALKGYKSVAEVLLERGADVNATDAKGRTPLHRAVEKTYTVAVAELLLARKADVDAKDKDGHTPLSWATKCRCQKAVELLAAKSGQAR